VPTMQRAMKLKKKRNLEPFKGNPSASLQPDKLNQIDTYVNLKIGVNSEEATFIINNLVANEQNAYDEFVKDNPEVMLPSSLELDNGMSTDPLDGPVPTGSTPIESLKECEISPAWIEVVRKGKTRSKSNKIDHYGRRILEY
jgi:hypothetical protein